MSIEIISETEDRVRIHIHLSNGTYIPDEDKNQEILYADIPSLPEPPSFSDKCPSGETRWLEFVHIPKTGSTIAYHFADWQETASDRMQAIRGGPYLVRGSKK